MSYVIALLAIQGLVSLAIAMYSVRGYLRLQSNTLKYFSIAFILLFLGFMLSILSPLIKIEPWISYVVNALHMFGYIFLAISHIISVRKEITERALPAILVPTVVMKSVGLYFLLYAAVETTIFSMKKEHRMAFASSVALYLIFLGEFLDLILPTGVPQALPSLVRFTGFIILLLPLFPVLKPSRGESR